jgi:hypothetical protein
MVWIQLQWWVRLWAINKIDYKKKIMITISSFLRSLINNYLEKAKFIKITSITTNRMKMMMIIHHLQNLKANLMISKTSIHYLIQSMIRVWWSLGIIKRCFNILQIKYFILHWVINHHAIQWIQQLLIHKTLKP